VHRIYKDQDLNVITPSQQACTSAKSGSHIHIRWHARAKEVRNDQTDGIIPGVRMAAPDDPHTRRGQTRSIWRRRKCVAHEMQGS
jgi:hypothetical protein